MKEKRASVHLQCHDRVETMPSYQRRRRFGHHLSYFGKQFFLISSVGIQQTDPSTCTVFSSVSLKFSSSLSQAPSSLSLVLSHSLSLSHTQPPPTQLFLSLSFTPLLLALPCLHLYFSFCTVSPVPFSQCLD